MQKSPLRQLHSPALPATFRRIRRRSVQEVDLTTRSCKPQFFLLALTEPSLQMKVLPWQREMPPL
jgi:hypothetical protein